MVAIQLAIDGKSIGISLFGMDLKKEIGVFNFTCERKNFRATLYGGTAANEDGILDLQSGVFSAHISTFDQYFAYDLKTRSALGVVDGEAVVYYHQSPT